MEAIRLVAADAGGDRLRAIIAVVDSTAGADSAGA